MSNFSAWWSELWKRLTSKSPKFFQILQWAGIIATGIGFIPDALKWLDITPNDGISKYLALAVKVAGGVLYLIAKLPVENASNLPFTPFTQKQVQKETEQQAIPTPPYSAPNDSSLNK